jgi:AmpD protein
MAKPDPQAPATTTMGPAWTWQGGWLQQARHLPSPNFGERPAQALVDLVVVHSISLPPGEYGLEVSAHFFVTRLGEVWQFVDCDARAWHAGASSWRGKDRCNDDSIGIELEGLEGLPFESAQYAALENLCEAIAARYPVAHLAGHEHIAPGRKRDPGPGFDWPRLRGLLSRHQATANWQLPPRAGQPST